MKDKYWCVLKVSKQEIIEATIKDVGADHACAYWWLHEATDNDFLAVVHMLSDNVTGGGDYWYALESAGLEHWEKVTGREF